MRFVALVFSLMVVLVSHPALAEEKIRPPKTALSNVFDRFTDFNPNSHFDQALRVEDVEILHEEEPPVEKVEPQPPAVAVERKELPQNYPPPLFGSPQVRPSDEAPASFRSIVQEIDNGNEVGMRAATSRFVDYLSELFFKVNLMTRLIGEELVKRKQIAEEDLEAGIDFVSYGMAAAREAQGFPVRIDYETAMKKIVADSEGRADVYYFFTLSCSSCRRMAPDVERLWRATLRDSKVRMAVLTLGPQPKEWVESYRQYTGLTMPIENGEAIAKTLGVNFAPTIVVVAPTGPRAYRIVGEQDFRGLLTFVRTVQGAATDDAIFATPEIRKLNELQIGQIENLHGTSGVQLRPAALSDRVPRDGGVSVPAVRTQSIERF